MKTFSLMILSAFLILSSCIGSSEITTPPIEVTEHVFKVASHKVDYAIQGEYGSSKKGLKWGVQVVALDKGEFDAYLLQDGLPGAGWERKKGRYRVNGKLNAEGVVVLKLSKKSKKPHDYEAEISKGQVVVKKAGIILATLPHIYRQSSTMGAKAPKDAVVLFVDASSEKNWKGPKGKIVKNNLLQVGVTSKATFQDHKTHFEFRLPFKPAARWQGRGNSGYYVQGRYETQILDSFGLVGWQNECGGVYSIAAPLTNACFPPLVWQTYDVDFKAAKFNSEGKKIKNGTMTVRLNGILVHENLDLTHRTTASPLKEGPTAGPLNFQNHGNPVQFRNVWVVKK